jgi:Tol biopolymer transport system component
MYNASGMDFAPNGGSIFLYYTGEKSEPEAWVLPFPAGASPRRVLKDLPQRTVLTSASWMPDSRHVVFGISAAGGNYHLWFGDTASENRYQITTGTSFEFVPAVSPNGKTLGFEKQDMNLNVISVSITGNEIHTLLGTERNERMAAWATKVPALAYVTDRNGPMEVWIRSSDASSRPAVTQDTFPGSKTQFVMNPSLSPDADRVIFVRQGPDGANRNWIMSLTDGVPQRLNESATETEYGGTWSPDGKYFAYLQLSETSQKTFDLRVIKVGSAAPPTILHWDIFNSLPDWSPTGQWITFQDESG